MPIKLEKSAEINSHSIKKLVKMKFFFAVNSRPVVNAQKIEYFEMEAKLSWVFGGGQEVLEVRYMAPNMALKF